MQEKSAAADAEVVGFTDEGDEVEVDDVDEVATALLRASRVLVAVVVRSLAAGEEPVTVSQLRMLVVLQTRGQVNLAGLAADLDVSPSTALRMVERLVRSGLVDRETDPADRRAVLLTLTPAGRALVERVSDRRRHELAVILRRMPAGRRDGVRRALEAFSEAAGEPPVPESGASSLPNY